MDHYHKDHYKVFNFCCEPGRGYNPEVFYGRVERYPFKDHNTPPLETMAAFGNSVKQWLDTDPQNVVNMHCKAGKGRAGLMCCVALIRTGKMSCNCIICTFNSITTVVIAGFVQNAKEALDLYDRERVNNNRGLTVTSQRKWVIFYEALWRQIWLFLLS
jgi:phosphatidylinositol-3,4,5-trisphosphate 3-phosphatase/dual-specificity protein phosphatase PTEN